MSQRSRASAKKAIDYSVRAADAAFTVFAFEEAGSHWRAALQLMDDHGGGDQQRRAQVLWRLSDALVSPAAKAVEYCEAALQLFETGGDNQYIVLAHTRLATHLSSPSLGVMNVPRAMEHFRKAEALLTETSPENLITYYVTMAFAWYVSMRTEEGLLAARSDMEAGERFGSDLGWAWGAIFCSDSLVWKGLIAEGLNLAEQARKRAERIGDQMLGTNVAGFGGANYFLLKDIRSAQPWFTNELAKPRTKQARTHRRGLMSSLASPWLHLGEFAEAHRALAAVDVDDPPAYFLWMEGPWERANRAWASSSLERYRISGGLYEEALERCNYGSFLYSRGELVGAADSLETALAQTLESGHIIFELVTRQELVWVLLDLHRSEEAISQIERCRTIMANGKDWRGLAALMTRAEGVLLL